MLCMAAGSDRWQTIAEAFRKITPSKYSNVPIKPGDRVRVMAPVGHGYGDPELRERADVIEDVREGFVTAAGARDAYGVETTAQEAPLRRAS